MSRYIERLPIGAVEAWQTGGHEPMPSWVPDWTTPGEWIVKTHAGFIIYTDDEFRRLYELADPIPDDDCKFYSGFEILDAVNE